MGHKRRCHAKDKKQEANENINITLYTSQLQTAVELRLSTLVHKAESRGNSSVELAGYNWIEGSELNLLRRGEPDSRERKAIAALCESHLIPH